MNLKRLILQAMRGISKVAIDTIKVSSYLPITYVDGPGARFCIWVQGCTIRCKGCANYHMWDKEGGISYTTDDLLTLIKSYRDRVEGVTFLGGEPLEQIKPVTVVSKAVQKLGLSVVVFTGYEYNDLNGRADFQELIRYVDILIDGKYEADKQDFSRAWVGSNNQKYYFLSSRYDESVITNYKNKIEVRINPDNKIVMSGMGDFEELKQAIVR